jgi:uncharacterized protein (TIGR00288 family)
LSPWWQRPTSEGAANEEKQEQADKSEPTPVLPAKPASPPTAPTADSDASSRFLSEGVERVEGGAGSHRAGDPFHAGKTGDAGAAAPVTSAAGPAPDPESSEPSAARGAEPSQPAQQLDLQASPAHSEPYRAFWQPREPASSQEAAPGPLQPAAAAAPAAAWRTPEGADLGSAASPAPPATDPAESAGYLGHEAAARARHEPRGPRPIAAPFQPSEPAEPTPSEPIELEAEAEAEGDGEVEERDEESRPEVKKKRSRRSRGGRRKNGRTAAGTAGAGGADPAEEDDDEDAGPEELAAQLAPAPPAPSAPSASLAPGPLQLTPRATRGGESYVISANDLDSASREIIISVPDRQRPQHEERKIAVFCDFENIALGVRDSEISKFDIGLILERLLEKGKIIVKKAYADWERYSDYKRPFHEAAIELIDIPQKFYSGKNSADIKMVVDAMDMSYAKEHLDTFVILSGDSDFSPLVSKLKENNKYVIGIGVKNSSSNLLVDNCDEFIYYEDIWRDAQKGPKLDGLSKKTAEAFSLMVESIQALVRENKDVLWGSMIKQTMQRKKPSFNEGYYGYSTFSELLEDAERKAIVKLKKDQRSGTYIVTGFAKSGDAGPGRRQA